MAGEDAAPRLKVVNINADVARWERLRRLTFAEGTSNSVLYDVLAEWFEAGCKATTSKRLLDRCREVTAERRRRLAEDPYEG